jgi:hypothetical protein
MVANFQGHALERRFQGVPGEFAPNKKHSGGAIVNETTINAEKKVIETARWVALATKKKDNESVLSAIRWTGATLDASDGIRAHRADLNEVDLKVEPGLYQLVHSHLNNGTITIRPYEGQYPDIDGLWEYHQEGSPIPIESFDIDPAFFADIGKGLRFVAIKQTRKNRAYVLEGAKEFTTHKRRALIMPWQNGRR